jgi:hypothetical protein
MPSSADSVTRCGSPSAHPSTIVAQNHSPNTNNNKKLFLSNAANNGFLRVLSANNSPTGTSENNSNVARKNSSTSEKNHELQQLLVVGCDGVHAQAEHRQDFRITENPLVKRNPADVTPGLTQPTMNTVVRYDAPTPVVESARGRYGCWLWNRKANRATRKSLERSIVVLILLLIAGLGFLIFGFLFQLECSDGKACQLFHRTLRFSSATNTNNAKGS